MSLTLTALLAFQPGRWENVHRREKKRKIIKTKRLADLNIQAKLEKAMTEEYVKLPSEARRRRRSLKINLNKQVGENK